MTAQDWAAGQRTLHARWSEEDWRGFIEAICGAYVESLVEQQIASTAALAKVQTGVPV